MSLPTPIYDLSNHPDVYDPSEDTFLFIDALEAEADYLQTVNPTVAVEIGSGSGVVISALASILCKNCMYLTTDVNNQACEATAKTAQLNHVNIECVNMDMLFCFKPKCFDLILFNPPYVITEDAEVVGNGLNRAWAGGGQGRVIIDKLVNNLDKFLSESGVCYMVLLRENEPNEIGNRLQASGFKSVMVLQRKIPGEHLFVYKYVRISKVNSVEHYK